MTRLGPNLKLGSLLLVLVFALSSLALFGGARLVAEDEPDVVANGPSMGGCAAPAGPVAVSIVGNNLMFDTNCFAAQPGAAVTVLFDHQDAGVFHNVAFYTNNRATEVLFPGQMAIFLGVATREVSFAAPDGTGNFFFRCDVHPDTMTGQFRVQPPPAAPADGSAAP